VQIQWKYQKVEQLMTNEGKPGVASRMEGECGGVEMGGHDMDESFRLTDV
jgi:hypothetical protein